jgi:hypothetical protein
MDTGNRFERDPRSGTQQAQQARDETGVTSGQWSNPASSQGQGEERQGKFMCTARNFFISLRRTGQVNHVFLDNTEWSGDQYAQQARYGQAGHGLAGHQRSDDRGQGRTGAGRTSEPSSTSAQYGGSESDQTGGQDPTTGGNWQGERDDDETAGTGGGKPTVTSKVKGTSSLWGCVGAR